MAPRNPQIVAGVSATFFPKLRFVGKRLLLVTILVFSALALTPSKACEEGSLWDDVSDWFGDVWDTITDIASTIWDAISDLVDWVWDLVTDFFDWLSEVADGGYDPDITGPDDLDECSADDLYDWYDEGVNAFTPYEGNAMRTIRELELKGALSGPFTWTRYHNTVPRRGKVAFGQGGSWRHSWQFDLIEFAQEGGSAPHFLLTTPNGRRITFLPDANGGWAPQFNSNLERLEKQDYGFSVATAKGSVMHFYRARDFNGTNRYEMRELVSSYGVSTKLDYNARGDLLRVAEPGGRYFELTYGNYALQSASWQRFGTVRSVPGAGEWLEFAVPDSLRDTAFQQLRVIGGRMGGALAVAEVQFFAPGEAEPLVGNVRGTGVNIRAAFDGSPESAFTADGDSLGMVVLDLGEGKTSRVARIRILPVAGQEAALFAAKIEGLLSVPESRSFLSRVAASDGRVVDYGYDIMANPYTTQQHAVLARATYSDGTQASYKYDYANPDQKPLLTDADDARYSGKAKRIRYTYQRNKSVGMIHQEINPATGGVYASLELDAKNPDKRTIHYTDIKTVTYLMPKTHNGRPAERIDSLGRKTVFKYDQGGAGRILEKVDHAGRRKEFAYDDRGRFVSLRENGKVKKSMERDYKGRTIKTTDEHGKSKSYERDAKGRVTRVKESGRNAIEIAYHESGRVSSFKGKDGVLHRFTYDAKGNPVTWTNPRGGTISLSHDATGRIIGITDPLGRNSRREVNDRGQTIRTIRHDGKSTSNSYDRYGRKTSSTDTQGRMTKLEYDELGRVTQRIDPLGRTTTFDYTELPQGCGSCNLTTQASRIEYPGGHVTTNLFDTEGRLLARTEASGTPEAATTLYAYDNDDNLVSTTDPLGRITRYVYDDDGHRLSATDPLGHVTRWTYDEHGNEASVIAPEGGVSRHVYDELDRRIATTDAAGNTTRFEYDLAGRMIALTDARGSTYRWEYDEAGRKTAMIYPDSSRETWTYDAVGRVLTRTTRAGQIKTLAYDGQGRLADEAWVAHAASDVHYTYTPLGQLASLDNGIARLSYAYDAAGRMIAETTTVAGQAPRTTSYGYDAVTGQQTSLTYPSGAIVAQAYAMRGEVAAISLDGASVATFGYNLAGQRTTLARANGVQTVWNTDDAVQLRAVLHTLGAAALASTSYEFDASGRRMSTTQSDGWTERYAYDATGQITGVEYFVSAGASQPVRRVDYAYDALGNRERMAEVDHAQRGPARHSTTHYVANNLNQYTRIAVEGAGDIPAYDPNGNLTRAQGVEYRYDARNQLIEVTTATERMTQMQDPKGRVIERRYFTKGSQGQWVEDDARSLALVYDAAWNVIEDRSTAGLLRARYVHGPRIDEILLRQESDGTKLFPLVDGLGSAVALTNAQGAVTQCFRYDVYGAPTVLNADYSLAAASSWLMSGYRFLFTGRESLGIAGLQDNRFRTYSTKLGRWLQVDPIGFGGLDFCLYRYAANQPVGFFDPMGLSYEDDPAYQEWLSCRAMCKSAYPCSPRNRSECYQRCMEEYARKKAQRSFSIWDDAVAWLRDNETAVVVGTTIVVVAGAIYVVGTAGTGAIVLVAVAAGS